MTKKIFVSFHDRDIRRLVGSDDATIQDLTSFVETALRERYGPSGWAILLSVDKILPQKPSKKLTPFMCHTTVTEKKYKYEGLNKYIESGDFDHDVKEYVSKIIAEYIDKNPPITPVKEVPEIPDEEPLTLAEAKRRLALSLGVDPSSIKITIEV